MISLPSLPSCMAMLLVVLGSLLGCGAEEVAPPAAAPVEPAPQPDADRSGERAGRWQPRPGVSWQWQLTGKIDTTVDAEVFELDAFDTPDAVIADLRGRGRKLICYVNAGAREDWRPDVGPLAGAVVGKPLDGWPDERWLDIRRIDVLAPVVERRLDRCADRGFDGVELDNVDGYANDSGFPLTEADQVAYNRFLADAAHRRGLAVGLKNAVALVPELVDDFDFAVNEECAAYDECEALRPFVGAGKAVFHVEYEVAVEEFCPEVRALGFSSMRKRLDLDAWRQPC